MTLPLMVTWRTDDMCPACGMAVTASDDGQPRITLHCGCCGWAVTWTGGDGSEPAR